MGRERLGCPTASMGKISSNEIEARCVILDTRRKLIWDWQRMPRTRIGTCNSKPKIHVPNLKGV